MTIEAAAMIGLVHVVIRGIVLIIVAIGGVLCIYWGWRLYRDGLTPAGSPAPIGSDVQAELATRDSWMFKMKAGGPGVFFALFGMAMLIYLVQQDYELDIGGELPPAVSQTSATMAGGPGLIRAAMAVGEEQQQQQQPQSREKPCLVPRLRIRGSDGRRLTAERIRSDLGEASRLLARLDRAKLGLRDRAALNDAQDTIAEIVLATGAGQE